MMEAFAANREAIEREPLPPNVGALLDQAVARASEIASPGDVVLLSPACSSFDMYESYEHRGRHFAELVGRLA